MSAAIDLIALLAAVMGLAWTSSGVSLGSLAWFFLKAGAFTFGSGWRSCRSCTQDSSTTSAGVIMATFGLLGFVKGSTAAAAGAIAGAAS
ncbi:MAG: hypothetical protein H0T69_17250 [Thermoleophilaceae bacterium]|nr:hypothetical protein [Thermoleophilaceae bacterium]